MRKKLLFLDIDGTLTLPGSLCVPESAQKAIRQAREKGHMAFLCTGRCLGKFKPLLKLGFDGAVGSAGGYVLCCGKVLYDHPMEEKKLDLAVKAIAGAGMSLILETLDKAFAAERAMELLTRGKAAGSTASELARWQAEMRSPTGFFPLEEYDGAPVYKVVFLGEDPSVIPGMREKLNEEFDLCLHNIFKKDGLVHGELINRDFSKGSAIRMICKHLQVPQTETIGFGDSMNDLSMLETAGISVCMGNGTGELKKISDLICPPVDQDGLAAAFEQLGLI